MSLTSNFIDELSDMGFKAQIYKRSEIIQILKDNNKNISSYENFLKEYRTDKRGYYDFSKFIPSYEDIQPLVEIPKGDPSLIPNEDPFFVEWGNYRPLYTIIASGVFFPTFITGLSGNGKTYMVEQACAKSKREYFRVQISPETDEDDLIGGFRIQKDRQMVFDDGPVIRAMKRGSILLIDEIDRASNRLMCLQGILEGKRYLIKKTGEIVEPKPGFQIIATANTKGRGDERGQFTAATHIDEAFLERFPITLEQPYPPISQERKILLSHCEKFNILGKENTEERTSIEAMVDRLLNFADNNRNLYREESVNQVITTRRLCLILQTYSIFKNEIEAVKLCLSRFDEEFAVTSKKYYEDLIPVENSTIDDNKNKESEDSLFDALNEDIFS